MNIPLTLQMEIDLSAQSHSREIAEGFARLRKELQPPKEEGFAALLAKALRPMTPEDLQRVYLQQASLAQNAMAPTWGNPFASAAFNQFMGYAPAKPLF